MKEKYFLSIVCLYLFVSCASEKPLYILSEKNHDYTERCIRHLASKNGNAIGFMSSLANFSYVLSYSDSVLYFYKITIISNGKRRLQKQIIPLPSFNHQFICRDSILLAEQEYFTSYKRMMDGDYLLCRYRQNGQWRRDILGFQFKELLQGDFHSIFLQQMSKDMKTYHIWTQFYGDE